MEQPTEVLIQELKDEIEVLKLQNEMLIETINQANALMSAVPLWNTYARELANILSSLEKEVSWSNISRTEREIGERPWNEHGEG